MNSKYDLVIIGAGPGGYSASLRASKHGAKVAVIEKGALGGVCLNWGCIPTKTLLKSAFVYREIKRSSQYGIETGDVVFEFDKVMERKNKVISALKSGMNMQMKAAGVNLINGNAVITGKNCISVNGTDLECGCIIAAPGSSPAVPAIEGIDDSSVIYSHQALSMTEVPGSMVIIGGGVVGLEFAAMFNEFGTKVYVIEMKENLLPGFDNEAAKETEKIFRRSGIQIITSAEVKRIQNGTVLYQKDGEMYERQGEKVLVSVGRRPNTENIFTENLGIELDRGFVVTDSRMRTSVDSIYAVGDVSSREMLAHVAASQGIIAADNALGIKSEFSCKAVPRCVYTLPEIASVGLSEEEAKQQGIIFKSARYPVRANGRALADGSIEGFAKVISEKQSGRIIGVHIVAPYASEMIIHGTMIVEHGLRDSDIAGLIYPHPTVSEVIGEAVQNLFH